MSKRPLLTAPRPARLAVPLVLMLVAGAVAATAARAAAVTRIDQAAAASASPRKTVWDRVFSEAQAGRGEALYKKSCTVCHRDDLTGSDGPPLRGLDFFIRWREQTVAEMLDEIQATMPVSNPGSLDPQTYLDIVSFLFKFNGVPVGTSDLPANSDVLEKIVVTEKPAS
jgi:cytochrome c